MLIATIVIFLCGTANFAMHRWMIESGHPLVMAATRPIQRLLGRNATYVFEFTLLAGTMAAASRWWFPALMLYGVYTALNAAAIAWLKGPPKG